MLRPLHVVLVLLGAMLLLIPLHLMEGPTSPASVSTLEWLRLALALPGALLLPGLALAPLLLKKDLVSDGALDGAWWLLAAVGLNIGVQVVHLNVLRVLGLPIEWPALLALSTVETAGAALLMRRRLPGLRFGRAGAVLTFGFPVVLAMLIAGAVSWGSEITVDSSWNFYSESLAEGIDQPMDPGAITVVRATTDAAGRPVLWDPGVAFVLPQSPLPFVLNNAAQEPQLVPVAFLVHGPLGTTVRVRGSRDVLFEEQISQLVKLDGIDRPVERYWGWGTATAVVVVPTPPRGSATIRLEVEPPAGRTVADVTVLEWTALSSDELLEFARESGYRFMHPFQLLNVTENVRWADEVATDFVLSGRSPDGLSTLHQPPAWTYQLAPVRQLISGHMVTASGIFLAILALIGLGGLVAAREAATTEIDGKLAVLLGIGIGAAVLQHGRMMVSDGSMNFPDNLFALALLVAPLLLVTGRARTFLMWAVLATLLRYPGAVVVAMSAGAMALMRPDLRRRAALMAMRFGLVVAVFCGVMLLVAVFTDALEAWLFALWFETVPEHFDNNSEALPLLRRPLEFLRIWGLAGGGVLLVAVPFRGTLARVLVATALLYAPFLAFIDHFSHHYFLPLIALAAAGAAASIAAAESPGRRLGQGAVFAAVSVALLGAATHLNL